MRQVDDWSKAPQDQLDDAVADGDEGAMVEAGMRLEREVARLQNELDAAGAVAIEAAEWVRRLSEAAPLMHPDDRREGEAHARAWLKAFDSFEKPAGSVNLRDAVHMIAAMLENGAEHWRKEAEAWIKKVSVYHEPGRKY